MDEPTIREMLGALGVEKIRSKGRNLLAQCPLAQHTHSSGVDRNPSFTIEVNPNGTSKWFCFSCNNGGKKTISLLYALKDHGGGWRSDIHEMIRRSESVGFKQRVSRLNDYDKQRQKHLANFKKEGDWHVEGYEATFDIADYQEILSTIPQYAIDRGITPDQAFRWKVGFHRNCFDTPRLFFCILDENQKMVGWSGRALSQEERYEKYHHVKYFNRKKYLYGENMIDRENRVGFLMEGFMDVLNLDRLGLKNCLGTMGVHPSGEQVDKLKKWFDHVIIFPHDDTPLPNGEKVGDQMAKRYYEGLQIVGVDAIVAPTVPHKRMFGDELRNPQDPGEWNKENLDWVMGVIRRQVSERKCEAKKA